MKSEKIIRQCHKSLQKILEQVKQGLKFYVMAGSLDKLLNARTECKVLEGKIEDIEWVLGGDTEFLSKDRVKEVLDKYSGTHNGFSMRQIKKELQLEGE